MGDKIGAIGSKKSSNIADIYKDFAKNLSLKKAVKKFNVLTNGQPNCVFIGSSGSNSTASGVQ